MSNPELLKIAKILSHQIPKDLNGADCADIYVLLGKELGMTHLLMPEARPNPIYSLPLPKEAPEVYKTRDDKSEKVVAFIRRVYAPWLGQGLARNYLRYLDPSVYHALHNWLKKNPWPEDLDLPSKKELNDRELAHMGLNEGETLPYPSYYTGLKDKIRLYNAARNRAKQQED